MLVKARIHRCHGGSRLRWHVVAKWNSSAIIIQTKSIKDSAKLIFVAQVLSLQLLNVTPVSFTLIDHLSLQLGSCWPTLVIIITVSATYRPIHLSCCCSINSNVPFCRVKRAACVCQHYTASLLLIPPNISWIRSIFNVSR